MLDETQSNPTAGDNASTGGPLANADVAVGGQTPGGEMPVPTDSPVSSPEMGTPSLGSLDEPVTTAASVPQEPSALGASDAPASPSADAASTFSFEDAAAAPPAPAPPPVSAGAPTPTSLNNVSDEDLFGAHMAGETGPDYGGTFRTLSEGEVVKGEIVRIDREGVLVDVGQKSEGLVRPQEMGRDDPEAPALAVGDTISVMVIAGETSEGQILLSKKRADFEKAWDHVIEAQQKEETITAMVTDRVKGGLVVDLGIRGFIPASHVGNGKVRNLEKYIGESLPLKVIEVDKERRKVVLSHRLATEGEREKQREDTMENLKEGQVRAGVVRRITDYGAFVDLGGVDGLLHISEMSWSRIKHPSEVVKQGQEIQVMVLKVNMDQGRISLGMRQILPDPWTEASQKYHPGDVLEGKITRLVQSGAFMQLDGGIEGFIKNSELAQRRVTRPEDVVKVGDSVNVKVLDVRPDERRIELSRKAQEPREEREPAPPREPREGGGGGGREPREGGGGREGRGGGGRDRSERGGGGGGDFRAKPQQEERFTLGDILGDALAERRAAAEAAANEAGDDAGVANLAADDVSNAASDPGVGEPPATEDAYEAEASAPNAGDLETGATASDDLETGSADAGGTGTGGADATPAATDDLEAGEAGVPPTPVAEAHAPAVEPLSQTEEQSQGEQPDIPA